MRDRLIGQVVGEVVVVGILVDVDVVVVLVEPVRLMEVREAVEDPVVALEPLLERPAVRGPASLRFESLQRCHFPTISDAQPLSRYSSAMVTALSRISWA